MIQSMCIPSGCKVGPFVALTGLCVQYSTVQLWREYSTYDLEMDVCGFSIVFGADYVACHIIHQRSLVADAFKLVLEKEFDSNTLSIQTN